MQPPSYENGPDRLVWLTKLYRAYAADLQRYIYSKVGDPFLAEDLTSTVFLKALRWLRQDQSEESARGWLYATARSSIADSWQTSGQHEALALSGVEDQLIPQMENADFVQQQAEIRVQRLLSRLSERERRVLTLRYLQGYSAAEIAQALGTNAGHIRVLQLRALKHAAQLERQERNVHTMQEQEASFEFFDSFAKILSPESLRVLTLAHEEALNLKHNFIGTEHLLWGLASEGSLTSFLTPLHITPESVHKGVVFIYDRQAQWTQAGMQAPSSADEPANPLKMLTPRTQQTIILAGNETKSQGEQSIRPAHLLLGLIDEGSGIGAGLLRSMGVNLLQARSALIPSTMAQACSFCGRNGSMVKRIFVAETNAGTAPASVFICDRCVERFHGMLY